MIPGLSGILHIESLRLNLALNLEKDRRWAAIRVRCGFLIDVNRGLKTCYLYSLLHTQQCF